MSHRQFYNLCKIIGENIDTKLDKEIVLLVFVDQNCNCNYACKLLWGKCTYGGKYRKKCIIYKYTCRETGKYYIGTTQHNFRNRILGYFSNIKKVVCKNVRSDSFANYFSNFFNSATKKPTPVKLRQMTTFKKIGRVT